MTSVFSMIIDGTLPGRFVYKDDQVVAFLSIEPLKPGHTLVVPRQVVDKWTELPSDVWAHVSEVSQLLGKAVCRAWDAPRAGNIIAGFDVPHTHVHIFPAWEMSDYDFSKAAHDVPDAEMDDAAEKIRTALAELGVNWRDGSKLS